MQHTDFDIVIVGAGIPGLTLACALTRLHLKVAIVESQSLDLLTNNQALRVSALNRASEYWLSELKIWQSLPADQKVPYKKMYIWDNATKADISFESAEVNEINLGHIVHHEALLKKLLEKLEHYYSVSFFTGTQLTHLHTDTTHITLTLDNSKKINCALVVGADGKNSKVAALANIAAEEVDYEHHALVATIKTELSHQKTAYQVFLPTGPLALLPLADLHTCSIVWSANPTMINTLKNLSEDAFNQQINEATENCLGKITLSSTRFSFPLIRRHATDYVKPSIALIGDAAHNIHPLAGQGLNLGIADTKTLFTVIEEAVANRKPYQSLTNLRRYERQRKEKNLTTLAAMDGFKSLFGSDNSWLQTLRGQGLKLADRCQWIKKQFVRYALGTK